MSNASQHKPQLVYPEHAPFALEEAVILGTNVERLRLEAGMDISTFARVAGIARPTIYKVESGVSNLKLSYLNKIADALDFTIVYLLTVMETD